jgi:hypothetical protein
MECNILWKPPRIDKFYMDARVYEIYARDFTDFTEDDLNLVWRGLYLAIEKTADASGNNIA